MAGLREIWTEIVDSWKRAFPPPDATMADAANLASMQYFSGMENLTDPEKADVWKRAAGVETDDEKAERLKGWVVRVRDSLIEDGVSETSLAVFDSFVEAKWPNNVIAATGYWTAIQLGKLASAGMVLGAEGAYELARDLTPARPDESMAWRMAFTDKEMRPAIIDALKDRGWSDELITSMEKAHRQYTDSGAALALYRRGEIDQAGFFERLAKLGFDPQAMVDIEVLKDLIPGPTDLVRMGVREAWRDDIAQKWGYDQDFPPEFATWMTKQGYGGDWAKRYWRAHWVLPGIVQGFQMRHRDVINEEELQELLRISDIPEEWRARLTKVAYKPLTRVDVRRMHDMGVLTDEGVKRSYLDLGYDDANADLMTEFTKRFNDKTGSGDATEYKDLTRSVVIQAYRKGVITRDQAETRLLGLDYAMEEIGVLLELADWTQEIEDAPDYSKEYHRDIKSIVEKAYGQRVISHRDAVDMLVGVGLSGTDAEYTLLAVDFWWGMDQSAEVLKTIGEAYVRRGINRADALDGLGRFGISSDMMEQKMAEWDVQRNIRSRRLTEAQYRRALENELISVAEYAENLRGLGYTDYDIWILTAMAAGEEAAGNPPESGPLSLNER